ncbi:MAG TPA: ATP-binding cassette domain-containing protein [Alphaproteobacteria bacterium]|jgi:phospholipid/cholesterol/gamma-HCH transport system ATP-binding protein|nr:ATP-binding cassette domain-containing protein [Alphaproteobacteria bacterium]
MSTEPAKISVKGLKKSFGPKVVLDGLDVGVAKGESLVIIGASGSGKSVFLKCLLGIIRADAGSILVDGEAMTGGDRATRERVRHEMGMLFQGSALFDSLSVWENVAFALNEGVGRRRVARARSREIALEKLASVGLGPEVADLSPAELSGGMQKRVALARAIAPSPEILLFDEPTTGLDPIMADTINDLIVASVQKLGATAISITHDMASARKIATRIAMLYQGRIIWEGSAAEVENSGNPYVDQFVHGRSEGPIKMPVRAR